MPFTKKKIIAVLSIVLCIAAFAVTTTLALLMSLAGPVESDFTIGNVKISLQETTGGSYDLIPGSVIEKNPTVTVMGGSEDCWLFVKVTKTEYFDDYLACEMAEGWTHLGGFNGVYYRSVEKSESDTVFGVLKDNSVTVSDTLTEEKMSAIDVSPKITFKAYAVQRYSIEEAYDAWQQILKEGME